MEQTQLDKWKQTSHVGLCSKLSYKRWTSPDVIFDELDEDGSGRLTMTEVRKFFKYSPIDCDKLEDLYRTLDTDQSGEVSRVEWRAGFYKAGFDGSASLIGQSVESGPAVLLALLQPPRQSQLTRLHGDFPPCHVAEPAERGLTLKQMREIWSYVNDRCVADGWMDSQGSELEPQLITTYDVMRYVVKPVTQDYGCSYAERCGGGFGAVLQPAWTVVHWWGSEFKNLLDCLEQHSLDRGVGDETSAYWISAFALNQSELRPDISSTREILQATAHAIAMSRGVVCILDKNALWLNRIWCLYEAQTALEQSLPRRHKLFDVYTVHQHFRHHVAHKGVPRSACKAIGLTDGFAMADGRAANQILLKTEREKRFPLWLLGRSLQLSLEMAHASAEPDKASILCELAGIRVGPPPSDHPAFERANVALRGRFALAGLRVAIDQAGASCGGAGDAREARELLQNCCDAIHDSGLRTLTIDVSFCGSFDASLARRLVEALPASVEELKVRFYDVDSEAADALLVALGKAMVAGEFCAGYNGKLPMLRFLALHSNAITADGGYAIGVACGARGPPLLKSIDFGGNFGGSPTPFDEQVVRAIVATPPVPGRRVSFFGAQPLGPCLSGRGLTTADVILILASAARGMPAHVQAIDFARSEIDHAGGTAVALAIEAGTLPSLVSIDLSDNPLLGSSATKIFSALRARAKLNEDRGDTFLNYSLDPVAEFKVVGRPSVRAKQL